MNIKITGKDLKATDAIKEYTGYEPSIDSSMIKENKEDLDR